MEIIFSERILEYGAPGHPESPERVRYAYQYIEDISKQGEKYKISEPDYANEEDIWLAHSKELVELVKTGQFYDPDSPVYDSLFDYCLLAVGGALTACEKRGFSLMRPPGHHAGRDFLGGFCYFNNLAVAVRKSGLKTLIVDIDGHHGNGTEDIFRDSDQVTYISLHRQDIFPGTGWSSTGNIINCPLNSDCGDEVYLATLEKALRIAAENKFEQMAISAGFDAYSLDPLASLGLSTSAYKRIGTILSDMNLPLFGVLEGGYVSKDMGENLHALLTGLVRKK